MHTENIAHRSRSASPTGAPESSSTQRDKILGLLIAAGGGWVSLPAIATCAAQYNARIYELRRLGFSIVNRTEKREGSRHSWFRLASAPPSSSTTTSAPERGGGGDCQTIPSQQRELFPPGGRS
jgi:hypothetical protein